MQCWNGYLVSSAGVGAARIGCPAYQCKASHMSRGVLAHLVPPGMQGSSIFTRLETFRAEKARYSRQILDEYDNNDDEEEDNNGNGIKKDADVIVSRFCPEPRCNKLLRGTSSASFPLLLVCECGGAVCSGCGAEDGHLGLSCEERALHKKQVRDISRE
jgi:hypothetical protein